MQTDDYGYVFQPTVSDPNWAPYSDGHWVSTPDGWMWVSDEPWGWATYHYGRWANIDGMGWVWVPGYQWAPAWVSWRYGGGYCGWAPLPPGGDFGADFHFGGDVDVSFGIGAGWYNFIAIGDMGEPNYRGRYADHNRNFVIINNTRNVTNINYYGSRAGQGGNHFGGVNVGGPPLAEVNAHSHQHIQTVNLVAANQPGRSTVQGNSLAVYAPRVNPATLQQARPATVSRTISHPTFNRGVSISKPLQVTAGVSRPPPSAEAIQAASQAQDHIPSSAGISTSKTVIKTGTTHPTTTSPNEPTPQTSYHPQTEATPPTTYHPQTESTPQTTYHPQTESTPQTTDHPQTESTPQTTYHPQTESTPPTTYHPQTESTPQAPEHPQTESTPPTTYHSQSESAPQSESSSSSSASHSQSYSPSSGGGGGSSGGGGSQHTQSSAPPPSHSAPSQSSGGNSSNKDKKSDDKNQQGH